MIARSIRPPLERIDQRRADPGRELDADAWKLLRAGPEQVRDPGTGDHVRDADAQRAGLADRPGNLVAKAARRTDHRLGQRQGPQALGGQAQPLPIPVEQLHAEVRSPARRCARTRWPGWNARCSAACVKLLVRATQMKDSRKVVLIMRSTGAASTRTPSRDAARTDPQAVRPRRGRPGARLGPSEDRPERPGQLRFRVVDHLRRPPADVVVGAHEQAARVARLAGACPAPGEVLPGLAWPDPVVHDLDPEALAERLGGALPPRPRRSRSAPRTGRGRTGPGSRPCGPRRRTATRAAAALRDTRSAGGAAPGRARRAASCSPRRARSRPTRSAGSSPRRARRTRTS